MYRFAMRTATCRTWRVAIGVSTPSHRSMYSFYFTMACSALFIPQRVRFNLVDARVMIVACNFARGFHGALLLRLAFHLTIWMATCSEVVMRHSNGTEDKRAASVVSTSPNRGAWSVQQRQPYGRQDENYGSILITHRTHCVRLALYRPQAFTSRERCSMRDNCGDIIRSVEMHEPSEVECSVVGFSTMARRWGKGHKRIWTDCLPQPGGEEKWRAQPVILTHQASIQTFVAEREDSQDVPRFCEIAASCKICTVNSNCYTPLRIHLSANSCSESRERLNHADFVTT